MKKLLKSFIALAIVMTSFVMNGTSVSASNNEWVGVKGDLDVSTDTGHTAHFKIGLEERWGTGAYIIKLPNGEIAWCIEPLVLVNNPKGYDSSIMSSSDLSLATQTKFARYDYIYKRDYNNNKEWYSAIQYMIWEDMGVTFITHTLPNPLSYYRNIMNGKLSNLTTQVSFSRNTINMEVGETVTLTDTNGVLKDYKSIPKVDGLTIVRSGNDLKITANKEVSNVSLSLEKFSREDTGVNIAWKKDSNQTVGSFKMQDPLRTMIRVTAEEPNGNIEITKTDTNGTVLEGVEYEFSRNADMSSPFATLKTDSNGKIGIQDIKKDTIIYYREKATLDNLVLDRTIYNLKVVKKDTVTNTLENKYQRSDVEITKVENNWDTIQIENNGKVLSGAEIELKATTDIYEGTKLIYRANELIGKEVTNSLGQVKFHNLPIGSYYAKEVVAPNGYLLFEGQWNITVTYGDPLIEITETEKTVDNQVIFGKANLVKQDGNNVLLQGAVFGVYNSDDEELMQLTTDRNGRIVTPNLRFGEYYFKELQAPQGYHLNSEKQHFTISEHEETVFLTMNNEPIKARVRINKYDDETMEKLGNATFIIVKVDEQGKEEQVVIPHFNGKEVVYISEWTTDEEGQFTIEGQLDYGNYKLIETVAPEGYQLMEPIDFAIDENQNYIDIEVIGKVLDMEVGNSLIKGIIEILKVDKNTQEPLKDFTFKITNMRTGEVLTLKSNEEGKIVTDLLRYDKYMVQEVKVNGEYLIDEVPQYINITEHNKTYEVVFENEKPLGEITLEKVDYKNFEPVENAIYGLYDLDNNLLQESTTNDLGIATFNNVELGDYYIQEIYAPNGYIIDEKQYAVSVKYVDDKTPVIYVDLGVEEMREVEIGTSASFVERDKQEPNIVTLVDIVKYENLLIGKEYTVNGYLMNKETNEPILINDERVEGTTTFIAEEHDGAVEVYFTFDSNELKTETIVVFEEMYQEEILVAVHTDINDIDQTVSIPKLKTSASFVDRDKKEPNIVTLEDIVKYDNLVVGKEYTVNGYLMDKNTNEPILINGKKVEGTTTFTPTTPNGEVSVLFTFDSNELKTDTIVVFEELYEGERLIAVHTDINDIDQTVKTQQVQIVKVDSENGKRLKQAEFTLYNGKTVVAVKETDEEGIATFTVFEGEEWSIKETNAPKGYKLSKEVVTKDSKFDEVEGVFVIEFPNDLLPSVTTGVNNNTYLFMSIIALGFVLLFVVKRKRLA